MEDESLEGRMRLGIYQGRVELRLSKYSIAELWIAQKFWFIFCLLSWKDPLAFRILDGKVRVLMGEVIHIYKRGSGEIFFQLRLVLVHM